MTFRRNLDSFGATPLIRSGGTAPNAKSGVSVGHSPTAHQAAQPSFSRPLRGLTISVYYSAMPRRQRETEKHLQTKRVSNPTASEGVKVPITHEYVHSVRGKLKDNGLLKALMDDKKKEREL